MMYKVLTAFACKLNSAMCFIIDDDRSTYGIIIIAICGMTYLLIHSVVSLLFGGCL